MEACVSAQKIRNRVGWRERLGRLQGVPVVFDLRRYDEELEAINRLEREIQPFSDDELTRRARALRVQATDGSPLDSIRNDSFAVIREIARRTIGLRPFDVQIVAALALDRGAVVEMQTGEGKTLAAVMPAALNALTGRGVHVLTFNDYLARRDAEWMGPIYRRLGLSAGFIQQGMTPDERRRAYRADVTYVTAKEAGFDHLRDLLATDRRDLVHRPFHYAIVDEADSLLIDEARVPLVIAGSVERGESSAERVSTLVAALAPDVDFRTDENGRDVELTDSGCERVERALGCGNLHDEHNYRLLTEVNCALHAAVLLKRDVDYIVRDGRIDIVDEFTGRVIADRHWPDGLQAALEAKEGLARRPDGRILGSITLQHFLGGYPRLSGMTGTAQDAAVEMRRMYGLEVIVIPTNRPTIRIDRPDVVFGHRDEKERGLAEEIRRVHATGRPVLVGTLTVEESERLAARLVEAGIRCQVLNARNDSEEARIVANAGALGAVTISTNMAGRGTDIRLGGDDERDRDRVAALGGLHVIGTNRHESRRVDLQLRGRAGRQGDPGETRFFISLEDDLFVRFRIRNRLQVAHAQRILEGQNGEIRQTLWRYAALLEKQRRRVMDRRQAILLDDATPAAQRLIALAHIDRLWRDHLALCADLREGIHLVSLGGQDPLSRFTLDATAAFALLEDSIDAGPEDPDTLDVRGPSATWTYLVNDDPFKNQIGRFLTGPGRETIAISAGVVAMPLLILWGLVDRYVRKKHRT